MERWHSMASLPLITTFCSSSPRLGLPPTRFLSSSILNAKSRIFPLGRRNGLQCRGVVQHKDEVSEAAAGETPVTGEDTGDVSKSSPTWLEAIPKRYKVILMASLAFVICNMDKVNMSVAIIPMSHEFGWPATTAGLVQSSFFLGYAISQLPGGWLARKFSGKHVLRAGVFLWSLATIAVPLSASWLPGILASRVVVGLGEGVSPSAATDLIARTVRVEERSRAVSVVFAGLSVGSVAGLLLAPVCIENYGWESVFYLFGCIGVLWCLAFNSDETGLDSESIGENYVDKICNHFHTTSTLSVQPTTKTKQPDPFSSKVPWKAFFRSPAVWAMIYTHFCGNWGYYNLLAWLPTYASDELRLDLTNAALVSILPPLAAILVSGGSAYWADKMITSGLDTTLVRKICQSIAFLSPSACMSIVSLNPNLPAWLTVAILSTGIGLSSFSLSGLYCSHQDISPEYASVLLGITNTAGAIPGLVGIALTGYVYDETHSWTLALFAPSIFFYLSGVVVWDVFASSKPQSFES